MMDYFKILDIDTYLIIAFKVKDFYAKCYLSSQILYLYKSINSMNVCYLVTEVIDEIVNRF